jgi:hypothetical protein
MEHRFITMFRTGCHQSLMEKDGKNNENFIQGNQQPN